MNEKILYSEVVSSYHGLRILLDKKFRTQNVITQNFKKYSTLNEALSDFLNLSIKTKNKNDFVYKKIIATIYYLKHLLGYNIKYEEYIKNTIGVDAYSTPQKKIDELILLIKSKLKLRGIEYNKQSIQKKFYTLNLNSCELKFYLEKNLIDR